MIEICDEERMPTVPDDGITYDHVVSWFNKYALRALREGWILVITGAGDQLTNARIVTANTDVLATFGDFAKNIEPSEIPSDAAADAYVRSAAKSSAWHGWAVILADCAQITIVPEASEQQSD